MRELEPAPIAPRSTPAPDISLPLWDLDASLAVVERQLALDEPPTWAPWVAWALSRATQHGHAYEHLLDALASSGLSAEQLAWWRSITPEPNIVLREALDRSTSAHTRALLTTALALTEYSNSCPVAMDLDGACRAPGTQLLLRRSATSLERAQEHTKLARKRWPKLDVDAADVGTRALLAELELAVTSLDYEALLDADAPDDLDFTVEAYLHDSGVPAWEAEYTRQLARAQESKARVHAFWESTTDCMQTQLRTYHELLWIDARSSGVVLLRQARMVSALAETLDASAQREERRIFGPRSTTRPWQHDGYSHVGSRMSDPLHEQAHDYLELCIELAGVAGDITLDQACSDTLWQLDRGERPLVEFVAEPRASTTMDRIGVVEL